MDRQTSPLDSFLLAVHRRLNRFRFFELFARHLLAVAAVVAVVAAVHALRGHAVPLWIYLAGAGAVPVTVFIHWICRRWSRGASAHFADGFFGLKDSLSTALELREKADGNPFVGLQAEAAAASVRSLDPKDIPFSWPRRALPVAVLLALVAGGLAFKKPSPEVLEKLRIAEETQEKSGEINHHLEELVEELDRTLDEEERRELDTDALRREIAALERTEDRLGAMRQYAELERRLRETARRLQQRRNERILSRAGEEVSKDHENRALGSRLSGKRYREAAGQLGQMRAPESPGRRKPDEQRKQLARLKAASLRMADAARSAGRSASSSSSSANNPSSSQSQAKSGKSGNPSGGAESGGASGSGSAGGGDMESLLSELNEAVSDLDRNLENAAKESRLDGRPSDRTLGQCEAAGKRVDQRLQRLGEKLRRMAAQREARDKLLSLCQSLGQCQGYLGNQQFSSLGQCLSQNESPNAGGKGIGQGSTESRRIPGDEAPPAGELSQLRGRIGSGPSTSTVESADSGDGVSSRNSASRQLEFRKQMESFVQREDVPDDVKDGVKNYFTRIHGEGGE